jgi:hypothetical protein
MRSPSLRQHPLPIIESEEETERRFEARDWIKSTCTHQAKAEGSRNSAHENAGTIARTRQKILQDSRIKYAA